MKMNREMMRQIQQMQSRLAKAQQEMEAKVVEGSAGGGAVTITMNGRYDVLSLKIAPEVVDPDDVDMLQDLVIAALNEALKKAQALQSEHLSGLTAGMNLPGLP
jgi:hypothetical protein